MGSENKNEYEQAYETLLLKIKEALTALNQVDYASSHIERDLYQAKEMGDQWRPLRKALNSKVTGMTVDLMALQTLLETCLHGLDASQLPRLIQAISSLLEDRKSPAVPN